ncbi:MAG: DNA-directed RNA polymerase subunit beta' [Candidatus Liptonbacteria bacterium]|nr:DNA-directed RNA polymerase subunit beta' [Candidatus Liptonbacteria bacterium]
MKSLGFNVEPLYDEEEGAAPAAENGRAPRRENFTALRISVASEENILDWSHGEVTKPETINYRTQRPEKDGLFSERIFGPTKDYECYCGKYRRIRYKGVVCDKCGVEVTRSSVRRERIGHISLAVPVAHIWFLKSVPSRLSLILDVSSVKLERVVYYSAYIVTDVDSEKKQEALMELERELKGKLKVVSKDKEVKREVTSAAAEVRETLESLRVGQVLSEAEYFNLARSFGGVFTAGTGAAAIRRILERMDLRKETQAVEKDIELSKGKVADLKQLRRLKMLKSMSKNNIRPEWMIMTTLPVLPPDLRPMVALDGGRYATSDLNDLYRRVINRNNRLKKLLEIKAPDVIVQNEKRMLQEAVDALIDNSARFGTQQLSAQRRPLRSLADMLKGKQGRFRQNLLGKRVDYSGRSVIVVGPKLKLDQCGLPKRMALELFRPFVVSEIVRKGLAHNIRGASRVIEEGGDEVWVILEEIIKTRYVLLNRAPTLHRLSVQAFRPMLVEGLAIQLPPLVCVAFNADFDGDQMAVHLPLSDVAQQEAKEVMSAARNLLKPATGELIVNPTQDMVLGMYYLSRPDPDFKGTPKTVIDIKEALLAYDAGVITLHTPIVVNGLETTLGRLILNEALHGTVPYVNETLNKKKLSHLIEAVLNAHGMEVAREVLDRVKLLGFEMAMRSGVTWAMSDLIIPKEKAEVLARSEASVARIREQYQEGLLTAAERRARVISVWEAAKAEIAKLVSVVLPKNNPIYQIVDSGSRGSWSQPIQMMGMKGLVQNPKGEIIELPLKSSLKEGLSVLEYFISTHGARKGTTDTALKTAQAGYLTRRLVDVSQDITVAESDCRTKEGIEIRRSDGKEFNLAFGTRLFSRTVLEDVKVGRRVVVKAGDIVDRAASDLIEKSEVDVVKVRSPISCKTLYGVCAKCYGYDLGDNKPVQMGAAVGVVAAQSIGEPGTQLTMRTFHTGGVAGVDITHGLPRIEEIFEARPPKGRAILAPADGIVTKIEERGALKVISLKVEGKKKEAELSVPRSALIYIETGKEVKRGDKLSEGNIDLRELLELRGISEVERYIASEVQQIYLSEGAYINNKHIEVIVRQMFSRVRIKDAGDAPDFVAGEIIEKPRFLEVNRELKRAGRATAKAEQILMGITQISLTTESFLSAASFQDTARVLVRAAIEGRVDRLRGLKENVIIGRLIPVGKGGPELEPLEDEEMEEIPATGAAPEIGEAKPAAEAGSPKEEKESEE